MTQDELFRDRWALVTGASAGIGAELARGMARRGSHLVLVARRAERLSALASELSAEYGVRARAAPHDLADFKTPEALVSELLAQQVHIDHLINCAGFAKVGETSELGLEAQLSMLDVNSRVTLELTRRLLPAMKDAGRGGVLNVASVASFLVVPYMATYAASKAFVLHFTLALAEELRNSPIRACVLCPGSVKTEFQSVAGFELGGLEKLGELSAADTAERGLRGYERGRTIVVPGFMNSTEVIGSRLLGPATLARLGAQFMRWMGRA